VIPKQPYYQYTAKKVHYILKDIKLIRRNKEIELLWYCMVHIVFSTRIL